jgi:hypothetical protein
MKTFLHVGCRSSHKDRTTKDFNYPYWNELRLDTDENVKPDVAVATLDMSAVADACAEAVFSSHNIEHVYPHDVPVALAAFKRVLKEDGFVVIACPGLQSVFDIAADTVAIQQLLPGCKTGDCSELESFTCLDKPSGMSGTYSDRHKVGAGCVSVSCRTPPGFGGKVFAGNGYKIHGHGPTNEVDLQQV